MALRHCATSDATCHQLPSYHPHSAPGCARSTWLTKSVFSRHPSAESPRSTSSAWSGVVSRLQGCCRPPGGGTLPSPPLRPSCRASICIDIMMRLVSRLELLDPHGHQLHGMGVITRERTLSSLTPMASSSARLSTRSCAAPCSAPPPAPRTPPSKPPPPPKAAPSAMPIGVTFFGCSLTVCRG